MRPRSWLGICTASLCALHGVTGELIDLEPLPPMIVEGPPELQRDPQIFAGRREVRLRCHNGMEILLIEDPRLRDAAIAWALRVGTLDAPIGAPHFASISGELLRRALQPPSWDPWQLGPIPSDTFRMESHSDRTLWGCRIGTPWLEDFFKKLQRLLRAPPWPTEQVARTDRALQEQAQWRVQQTDRERFERLLERLCVQHPADRRQHDLPSLHPWWKQQLIPARIRLVLLSPRPLEEVISLAAHYLAALPDCPRRITRREGVWRGLEPSRGTCMWLPTVEGQRHLHLLWELSPGSSTDRHTQPATLLAAYLNQGDPSGWSGPLFAQGWIEEMDAKVVTMAPDKRLLHLRVALTAKGWHEREQVVQAWLQEWARLRRRGLPKTLVQLWHTTLRLHYPLLREEAMDEAWSAASALLEEPLETYPQRTCGPTQAHPTRFASLLDELHPSKAVAFLQVPLHEIPLGLASQSFSGVQVYREPWAALQAAAHPPPTGARLPPITAPRWLHLSQGRTTPLEPSLEASWPEPSLLRQTDRIEGWWASEPTAGASEQFTLLQLLFPSSRSPVEEKIHTELLHALLQPRLAQKQKEARSAGVQWQIEPTERGWHIAVEGRHGRGHQVLLEVVRTLRYLQWTEAELIEARAALSERIEQALQASASSQLAHCIQHGLPCEPFDLARGKRMLQELTEGSFLQWWRTTQEQLYCRVLFYGNLSQEEGHEHLATLDALLLSSPHEPPPSPLASATSPPTTRAFRFLSHGPGQAVQLMFRGPITPRTDAVMALLDALYGAPLERALCHEQGCCTRVTTRVDRHPLLGSLWSIELHAGTTPGGEMIQRCLGWLEMQATRLAEEAPVAEIEAIRGTLLQQWRQPPTCSTEVYTLLKESFQCGTPSARLWLERADTLESLSGPKLHATLRELLSGQSGAMLALWIDGRSIGQREQGLPSWERREALVPEERPEE